MKTIILGILAHVDAGKTTLAEALLYTAGKIKKPGRVDWRNTYLDTHELERERGITIFSKQAVFETPALSVTLLDTPGHVDFSAEAERVLSVLDYAVLVVSGSEGVQAHTETLWHLLERYRVPTFVFVTKMDLAGADRAAVLSDIGEHLTSSAVDMVRDPAEKLALCDEEALDGYMETGEVPRETVRRMIRERALFPVYFGSGLRLDGVREFLEALADLTEQPVYGEAFGARVYKIGHDPNGGRLTFLKVTGGALANRQTVTYTAPGQEDVIEEKITGLRIYSGAKYETREVVRAGEVCAATGLSATVSGQGLGFEAASSAPLLEPVLHYRIALPADADPKLLLPKFRELEEEEPLLHIVWNERYGEIHAQLMGEVQTEVLTRLIAERFGVAVTFEDGRILYKETITAPVEGVGHFEPLRHYAEVHLLMEPLSPGSGLRFDTMCSENFLERNWQRLILTHLEEKQHLGTLTGSPITDMKITLVSGRAHLKHTVGGDFREATYRAVREGLMFSAMRGECVLLEPVYAFRLEVPGECVGRAIADILARAGTFSEHEATPGTSILEGRAPVSTIGDYAREVAAYTHGRGRFTCRTDGYAPCHNAEEVIRETAYDPEADVANTPNSVFCSHGAGIVVPWAWVPQHMHLEGLELNKEPATPIEEAEINERAGRVIRKNLNLDEKELEAIMEREFGPIRRRVYGTPKKEQPFAPDVKHLKYKKSLYIVDGYNVIFAWDELAAVAESDLATARRDLCDILANYQAFTRREMIVVFDAYNVKGDAERKEDRDGLHVVFTKEGELGDTYIEKLVHEIGADQNVRVVTSDSLIQLQAVRSGVLRLSAREFRDEILAVDEEIEAFLKKLREENRKQAKKPGEGGQGEN
ncbi:MAG: NYN domain-containing protein [Clostridiales bacterium]|nr:NYN domain-containing protein [Clostridiales bacterium]